MTFSRKLKKSTENEFIWDVTLQVLILDLTEAGSSPKSLSITSWREGLHLKICMGASRFPFLHGYLVDWIYESEIPQIAAWKATIPREIQAAINHAPNSKMDMLSLAALEPAFADLLVSNPHLAWLSYIYALREKLDTGQYLDLISKRQRVILGEIGYINMQSVVNILRRLGSVAIPPVLLNRLMALLADVEIRNFLAHHPLSTDKIAVLVDSPWLATAPLGELMFKLDEEDFSSQFPCFPILTTHQVWLKRCKSLDEVRVKLARINAYTSSTHIVGGTNYAGVFPPPHLSDGKNVRSIRTQKELFLHGEEYGLCIGVYLASVIEGLVSFYFYKIGSNTVTFNVEVKDSGKLKIEQIKLANNELPDLATIRFVRRWFIHAVQLRKIMEEPHSSSLRVSVLNHH